MKWVLICATALAAATVAASSNTSLAQTCNSGEFEEAFAGEVVVPQNWNCEERKVFWFTDQGSQIVPYFWFLHLEQAGNTTKFSDPANMDRYRYLPQKPSAQMNPDGLPIGFTRGNAKGNRSYARISENWLGMTCSACHTGQVEFEGAKFLIDGAPTMGDFETMMRELVKALQATLDDDGKFDRFAEAVMADSRARDAGGTRSKARLRRQLQRITTIRSDWNMRNQGSAESGDYGHGRLDAVGAIYNETAVSALEAPENLKPADAPVSYPFVWDTPQHDKVQWNGSIKNAGLGSLSRNVGEVLGVFGALEINRRGILPVGSGHDTSVNVAGLAKLEGLLWKLQSPLWSDTTLPAIDPDRVIEGRKVFQDLCIFCHRDISRTDEKRKVVAKMIPIFNPADPRSVKTDPTMAANFLTRTAQARDLTGEFARYLFILSDGKKFEPEDQDNARQVQILAYSVAGTIVNELIHNPKDVVEALKAGRPKSNRESVQRVGGKLKDKLLAKVDLIKKSAADEFFAELGDKYADYANTAPADNAAPVNACFPEGALICYKARPLNGIWATAPYLHNGSVRTLRQLLLPGERQETFKVGSREFDPGAVGFVDDGASTLDTNKPGNSNSGHTYGVDVLSNNETMVQNLLEYLKSL